MDTDTKRHIDSAHRILGEERTSLVWFHQQFWIK